jgi:hypothetical protein
MNVRTRLRLVGKEPRETRNVLPLADRITALRLELARLEDEQRDELIGCIVAVVGAGVAFSAAELFAHRVVSPELYSQLYTADIRSVRQLGKKLRALGLTRVGEDRDGVLWTVE